MRDVKKYEYVWSNELAYAVGLIASDGSLSKDGRHVDLTSTDREQLSCFSKALKRQLYIGKKTNSTGHVSYRIQFSDVAFYDFLLEVGIIPNKSHTLAELKIPDEHYAHFLRGVFDGDGTVYGYIDERWKHSFMFYTAICSASSDFLLYLQSMNSRLFNMGSGSLRYSKKALILSYAKADSKKLYSYMYRNAENLYLRRKKEKLNTFIIKDQSVKMNKLSTSGEIGKHASLRG